uniref:Uncharacterized protein n=1 Tax=Timema tahoe TaxID=61484 RepID=A0A7R9P0T4_9NEOP|nr:unnamed protein product [Timema tahoe]
MNTAVLKSPQGIPALVFYLQEKQPWAYILLNSLAEDLAMTNWPTRYIVGPSFTAFRFKTFRWYGGFKL